MTVFALGALLALPAAAELAYVFEAQITGDQVVPPTGSGAGGVASIIINEDMTVANYTVSFAGLEGGAQTAAHFHLAAPGENGPVVFDLGVGTPVSGMWMPTAEEAQALMDGNIYVQIHTEGFPAGEIRGQFVQTAVSAEAETLTDVKALFR
jgi:hypothetical protein